MTHDFVVTSDEMERLVKKARYERAKNDLVRVTVEIEELSADILAMQSRSTPVVVARLP